MVDSDDNRPQNRLNLWVDQLIHLLESITQGGILSHIQQVLLPKKKKKIKAEPGTLPQLRRSYFVSIRNGLEVIKILHKEPHFQCGQII